MRIVAALFMVLAQLGVTTVNPGAAQTSGTALCDGIAAQIRANGTGDSLSLLFKGNPTYIERSAEPDMRVGIDKAQFMRLFREKYNPSDALARAVDFQDDLFEVFSLTHSDLHMIETTGGTGKCEIFRFFRTVSGHESEQLPNLPPKGTSDGDNLICAGYGDDGRLARIAGTNVFLESIDSETGDEHQLRVVPFQQDHWENACRVAVDFDGVGDHKTLKSVRVTTSN